MISDGVPDDGMGGGSAAGEGEPAKLIAEAAAAPVAGRGFSWLDGRASLDQPAWDYAGLLIDRMGASAAALDIETGDGELLARVPYPPPLLAATTSDAAAVELARSRLEPLGAVVELTDDEAGLPYPAQWFDLVTSRDPGAVPWPEIARVLEPGGSCIAQQVGTVDGSELAGFLAGSPAAGGASSAQQAAADARAAGLEVTGLREQPLRVEFFDVGAVVWFLRKVPAVPDFSVEAHAARLADLHRKIQAEGPFGCSAQRYLIEARKPGPDD